MQELILALIFMLLLIVVIRDKREKESWLWLKIILLYATVFLTFWVGTLAIPIGIILAFFLVIKWTKKNKSLKMMTLVFALVAYGINYLIVPPIAVENIKSTSEIHQTVNRFDTIEHVKVFGASDLIQDEIKQYRNDEPYVMFQAYILMDRGISIKNVEWLLYDSFGDLNYNVSSHTTDTVTTRLSETSSRTDGIAWEVYARFNETGEEYLGIFEKEGDELYLRYVVKGKFSENQKPTSVFDF